jgi:hypothetical protein
VDVVFAMAPEKSHPVLNPPRVTESIAAQCNLITVTWHEKRGRNVAPAWVLGGKEESRVERRGAPMI